MRATSTWLLVALLTVHRAQSRKGSVPGRAPRCSGPGLRLRVLWFHSPPGTGDRSNVEKHGCYGSIVSWWASNRGI